MNFLPCTRFLLTLVSVIIISAISTDQTNITAEVGQETFLPCRSPDNKPAVFVEWIRSDLGSEYVLLYRNRKINLENQHVMFKDRVDLQDRQMKDGNVSLVLKNVTIDDRGAYECRIIQTETNSRRETIIIIIINLIVTSPGEPDGGNRDGPAGRIGLVVGPVVASVILVTVVVVVCLICKKRSGLSPKSSQSSKEPSPSQQPLTDQNRLAEQ